MGELAYYIGHSTIRRLAHDPAKQLGFSIIISPV